MSVGFQAVFPIDCHLSLTCLLGHDRRREATNAGDGIQSPEYGRRGYNYPQCEGSCMDDVCEDDRKREGAERGKREGEEKERRLPIGWP